MVELNSVNELSLMERLPGLREVHLFDELQSTNDYGKQLLAKDTAFPAIIYARKQTKGRGRGGNSWFSTDGSLTFSFLIDLNSESMGQDDARSGPQVVRMSILWGLAVATGINQLCGKPLLEVKWPNDLMADDKKVAGILIETVAGFPGRMVVGIGINVSQTPSLSSEHPGSEPKSCKGVSILEASGKALPDIEILESIWKQIDVVKNIDDDEWLNRFDEIDFLKNRDLVVEQGGMKIAGRYSGLGREGELKLETGDGVVGVFSGSVVEF